MSWRFEPPLVPSPDEARGALRRELLKPDYQENPIGRLLDWISSRLGNGVDRVSSSSPVTTAIAILVALLLAAGLLWLLSRASFEARVDPTAEPVFTEEEVTADQLRARAEAALAEGDYAGAYVDGFRAAARRRIEAKLIADQPGATATELAGVLAAMDPAPWPAAAALFDAVLYGGASAQPDDVHRMLALDLAPLGARR